MRNASGYNYRNSSLIVDLATGHISRSTERISNCHMFCLFVYLFGAQRMGLML